MNTAQLRWHQVMTEIIWTEYLKYKANLRGFNLQTIEEIVRSDLPKPTVQKRYKALIIKHYRHLLDTCCQSRVTNQLFLKEWAASYERKTAWYCPIIWYVSTQFREVWRYSTERYYDTATDRWVVIGKEGRILVMIPHEVSDNDSITPITIHATTRQQVKYRVKSGRFIKWAIHS